MIFTQILCRMSQQIIENNHSPFATMKCVACSIDPAVQSAAHCTRRDLLILLNQTASVIVHYLTGCENTICWKVYFQRLLHSRQHISHLLSTIIGGQKSYTFKFTIINTPSFCFINNLLNNLCKPLETNLFSILTTFLITLIHSQIFTT